jgi:5-methyltetrahydrofolate--homocysteine methyltransferase
MIVIADNLNTRNKTYMEAVSKRDKNTVAELAEELSQAGADIINVQCSLDGSGDEETLPWVVEVLEETIQKPLSLDSRNLSALKKSIELCKSPPLVNYISETEPEDHEGLLEVVSRSGASLVLRASKTTPPTSLEAKLQIIENLLEAANAADIPNERLFADPSIVHIGRGVGQKHLVNSHECIRVLKEIIDPPINTIAWISNVSAGMPAALRKTVDTIFLSYLAGAGLDAAMVNVLDAEIRKTLYLLKSFRDGIVFSSADITNIT